MKNNKTQLNKTYIIIAVIIGIVILGYDALNFLSREKDRQLEQSKLQRIKQEQDQAKQDQTQAKQALDICLATAETNYSDNWYTECKSQGRLTDRCISLHDMTFEEYAKQNNILNLQDPQGKSLNLKAMSDFYREKTSVVIVNYHL